MQTNLTDMHDPNDDLAALPAPRSPLGHRIMFLILATMSFVVFIPTVLMPLLREYTDLLNEEAELAKRVRERESEVERREELLQAFQNDAFINERLAVLDLNYQRPNEVVLPVTPTASKVSSDHDSAETRDALQLPLQWPVWSHQAHDWARDRGLIKLFFDASLRPLLLFMSGGMLVAAFVLFAPRPPEPRRTGRVRLVTVS